MRDYTIVGVHVTERATQAAEVHTVLSAYGANIRTRLGLHEADGTAASQHGLILLEAVGLEDRIDEMCDRLRRLRGVQVQRMFFSHPED